jgi:hypothetical protein
MIHVHRPHRAGLPLRSETLPSYDDDMTKYLVARVAWDFPNGEEKVRLMERSETITFGRHPDCDIGVGRAPYDQYIPRWWGKLTWHGRLYIGNVATGGGKWSFAIHPSAEADGSAVAGLGPSRVDPGAELSPPFDQFEVRAKAPDGEGLDYKIRIRSIRIPDPAVAEADEITTKLKVELTATEKLVGRALITPMDEGRAIPPSYLEIAEATHFSRDGVRDAVERIDMKLIQAAMYPKGAIGKTPDRVASSLREQRHFLA